jgi:hypothetical protein
MRRQIHIGAVDTERNPAVASSHSDDGNPIQGVPTIKLFIPTRNKGKPRVVVYNGERKAKAIITFLTQHMPNHVSVLKDADGSHDRCWRFGIRGSGLDFEVKGSGVGPWLLRRWCCEGLGCRA